MGKLLAPRNRPPRRRAWVMLEDGWVGSDGMPRGSNRSQISGSLEFWMCKILKSKQLLYLTDAFPHLF